MVSPIINGRMTPMIQNLLDTRSNMATLEQKLSTGKVAETYGGLGANRDLSVAFRSDINQLESFSATIQMVELRLDIADQSLTRISDLATDARGALDPNIYQLFDDGSTQGQRTAKNLLGEALALLNTKAGERYVFSGASVETRPVETLNVLLEGDGDRAGFIEIRDERYLADAGTGTGRVDITQPLVDQVLVAEDADHPFGLKIGSINNQLTGATLNTVAGPPASFDLTFTGQPAAGETLTVELTLPDGNTTSFTLTAADPGTLVDGEFEIGATFSDTAANLTAAITSQLQDVTDGPLKTASAMLAGEAFFEYANGGVPQRVDGPPIASATALRDATENDTVFWYRGENGTDPARGTLRARIDEGIVIGYGARANEEGFTTLIKNLAVFATDSFTPGSDADQDRYRELAAQTLEEISYPEGTQTLQGVASELGAARSAAGRADERHTIRSGTLQSLVDGVETADINEVAVSLLALQTQLEASYRATSLIYELSLTNYI